MGVNDLMLQCWWGIINPIQCTAFV